MFPGLQEVPKRNPQVWGFWNPHLALFSSICVHGLPVISHRGVMLSYFKGSPQRDKWGVVTCWMTSSAGCRLEAHSEADPSCHAFLERTQELTLWNPFISRSSDAPEPETLHAAYPRSPNFTPKALKAW